jgi:RES domain-containing protein
MIVYRICKSEYTFNLSGKGAEKYGGRWNSKGVPMVYTGQTIALCTTEIAVHTPLGIIPNNYMLISLEIPEEIQIQEINISELPKNWRLTPYTANTQNIGDKFITEKKFPVLKIPSAVVQGENNFLLNPNHLDFQKIKILSTESFSFDKRLFIREK